MAAFYCDGDSDDDGDELEDFDFSLSSPRYVVPSYAQLCSLQLAANARESGGTGGEDDGWNSDDEACKPVIPVTEEEEG